MPTGGGRGESTGGKTGGEPCEPARRSCSEGHTATNRARAPWSFPDSIVPPEMVAEAEAMYGIEAGEQDALDWAGGFRWSAEQRQRDTMRLRQAGSLERLVAEHQAERAPSRISVERIAAVARLVPGLASNASFNEVWRQLEDIAANGMEVRPPRAFRPSGAPQARRAKEKKMEAPIAKLIGGCWDHGYCLLVDTAALMMDQNANGCSYNWCASGWAKKRGKAKGRCTHDCSFCDPPDSTLNLPRAEAKAIAVEQYGPMYLPELRKDLMPMVLKAEEDWGDEELEL